MLNTTFEPLTDNEILELFNDLKDSSGQVTFEALQAKLEEVYKAVAPEPSEFHLTHAEKRGRFGSGQDEEAISPEADELRRFLHTLVPEDKPALDIFDFVQVVKSWGVPSQNQTSDAKMMQDMMSFQAGLPITRRLRTFWTLNGDRVAFLIFVVAVLLGFAFYELSLYIIGERVALQAFGPGLVFAKFNSGLTYGGFWFTVLSMSRIFTTSLRRLYYVASYVNVDLSRDFHVFIGYSTLLFGFSHTCGHVIGSFTHAQRQSSKVPVAELYGYSNVPQSYGGFLRTTAGYTGMIIIGLFLIMGVTAAPQVRRYSYEIFQIGHLLMYPLVGFLSAHGTESILQLPMFGYWLFIPSILVIVERGTRVYRTFRPIQARMTVLDKLTVTFTCKEPSGKAWRYQAGQYIFFQVPQLSRFQWHPFTVSACQGNLLQVHIKTDGDWTSKLRQLPTNQDVRVAIDGPWGAPAQRFYDFDRSIIIGSGIGVTPFSAIITDLEQKLDGHLDPWASGHVGRKEHRNNINGTNPSLGRLANRSPSGNRNGSNTSFNAPPPANNYSRTTTSLSGATLNGVPEEERQKVGQEDGQGQINGSFDSFDGAHTDEFGQQLEEINSTGRALRRVDFHWLVRDQSSLTWFSDLLNRAIEFSQQNSWSVRSLSPYQNGQMTYVNPLQLNVHTHITTKPKAISQHVFRYLLDRYRSPSQPVSALTGLLAEARFGRPNFTGLVRDFHDDMLATGWVGGKVGVFFCGAGPIGAVLADTCAELTTMARNDGSNIKYVFHKEVFG